MRTIANHLWKNWPSIYFKVKELFNRIKKVNQILKSTSPQEKKFNLSVEISSIILIISLGVLATITDRTFIAGSNFFNIADATILYLLLGLGLTFVLMSGSVNLAVGGMLSLNCVIFALLSEKIGLWSIPLVLLCGFLEGIITGQINNIFRIPSFIATFGMMGIFTSIAVVLSGGESKVLGVEVMKSLRSLHLTPLPGIKVQYIITAVIFFIFLFIQKRTAFGKKVISIGDSPTAAKHIGINIEQVKQIAFGLSGLSTAIGAILLSSRLYAGDPTVGTGYLLLIVAVVIVGGTSLSGGVGGIFNTLLGALTIAVVQNVLQIMGVNIYYHSVVIGVVLIIAVAISLDQKKVLVVK